MIALALGTTFLCVFHKPTFSAFVVVWVWRHRGAVLLRLRNCWTIAVLCPRGQNLLELFHGDAVKLRKIC